MHVSDATVFEFATQVFSPLREVSQTGSTNEDVLAHIDEPAAWPHFSALVCLDQRSGRGRRGRRWVSDPGAVLAVSVVLRPVEAGVLPDSFGHLPLVVGLALREALLEIVPVPVGLKWPNDVQAGGRKVAGILCEASPSGAVVVGAGVNLRDSVDALAAFGIDASTVTSIAGAGGNPDADRLLSLFGERLRSRVDAFFRFRGSLVDSGLLGEYRSACVTIGENVRVDLPGGGAVRGLCIGVDAGGRLLVDTGGTVREFTAGDVHHVRRESSR